QRVRWRWSLQAAGPAAELLQRLRPFSILKTRQIELALRFLETIGRPGKRLTASVRRRRMAIARHVAGLNGCGNGRARGIGEAIERLGDHVYAYAGGVFECEGTIGITRACQLCIGIEMIDWRVP